MKRNPIYLVLTFSAFVIFSFTACVKTTETNPVTNFTTQSDDQFRFSSETDAVANDANIAIESSVTFSGKAYNGAICDATISYDSLSPVKTVTITYNGANCSGNRVRTGSVVLSLLQDKRWSERGATVSVEYKNVKVVRAIDNKSITLNGTIIITNETGGRIWPRPSLTTVSHLINSDDMRVSFDNGQQRTWHIAQRRDYTYDNGIVVTVSGTHVDGSVETISEWGVDRLGKSFTTQVSAPLVFRQDCEFKLGAGEIIHTSGNQAITITFGLDAMGEAVTCAASGGHYNFKIQCTILNQPYSFILPY